MGSIFKPSSTVVSVPSSSQATTSGEVKPYAPVEPYIEDLLPRLESTFAAPVLCIRPRPELSQTRRVA
jgi:hypothetical protein